jgi:hypothetical protein
MNQNIEGIGLKTKHKDFLSDHPVLAFFVIVPVCYTLALSPFIIFLLIFS